MCNSYSPTLQADDAGVPHRHWSLQPAVVSLARSPLQHNSSQLHVASSRSSAPVCDAPTAFRSPRPRPSLPCVPACCCCCCLWHSQPPACTTRRHPKNPCVTTDGRKLRATTTGCGIGGFLGHAPPPRAPPPVSVTAAVTFIDKLNGTKLVTNFTLSNSSYLPSTFKCAPSRRRPCPGGRGRGGSFL